MTARRFFELIAVALGLTLLSTVFETTQVVVQDWDCPPAPASCARPMAAVGFPLPYIIDFHGLSPVGSADIAGALLGMDHFRAGPFAIDFLFYLAIAGLALLWRVRRNRIR